MITVSDKSEGLLAAVRRGQVCCFCGASAGVQTDHVRPRHAGGQPIVTNLAPLCVRCNAIKSCYWPGHGYHPMPGWEDAATADAILDAEFMWLRRHHPESDLRRDIWPWYGVPDGRRWAAMPDGGLAARTVPG
jgi:hypothetical protein